MTKTFGSLSATDKGWTLSDMPPHVAMRFKRIFQRVRAEDTQPFHLTRTPHLDADLAWFLQRFPMRMSPADAASLATGRDDYLAAQAGVEAILAANWKPSPITGFREGLAPYPYQAQAAEIARRLGRLLIMDDVGLGKTISAIAAIADKDRLPAAIVVQTHLARQWAIDYIQAFTTMTAHVVRSTAPYELPEADCYVFTYSKLAGWVDYFEQAPFKSVVFDEVQELRHGTNTQKGKAARALVAGAQMKIGLSATPIYNYGSEMHAIIEAIDPGALGSREEFLIEWCVPRGSHWIVQNPVAFGSYLEEQRLVIRRTETEVGWQMPPVNVIEHTVPFDEEVAADSRALAQDLALKVMNGSWHEKGQAARELDALARLVTGMAKAKPVAGYVRMLAESGRKVLLAGWHRDVYDVWLDELREFRPVLYTGSESEAQKQRSKAAFCGGASQVMMISLRSGAGLDGLQHHCHTVVHGELDWSPLVHKQIVGRLRRPGQKEQVDSIFLHCDGGSDPTMIAALGVKGAQSRGIVDPWKGAEQVHSDIGRIERLARAYLASHDGVTFSKPNKSMQLGLELQS